MFTPIRPAGAAGLWATHRTYTMQPPAAVTRPTRSANIRSLAGLGLAVALLAALAGCGTTVDPPNPSDVEDGNKDPSLTSPLGKTSGEPNDTFEDFVAAVFSTAGRAELVGNIRVPGDIDIYHLGALAAGTKLVLDAETPDSTLDVSLVLFDADEGIVYENDDQGTSGSSARDSHIEFVTRHDSDAYYVAVSHSAFGGASTMLGDYTLDIQPDHGRNRARPAAANTGGLPSKAG